MINIINAAQESSPVTVAEALDRVLEILRTTELYSPQLAAKEDDPHTNDLVGGLMNVRSGTKVIYKCIFIILICCFLSAPRMGSEDSLGMNTFSAKVSFVWTNPGRFWFPSKTEMVSNFSVGGGKKIQI